MEGRAGQEKGAKRGPLAVFSPYSVLRTCLSEWWKALSKGHRTTIRLPVREARTVPDLSEFVNGGANPSLWSLAARSRGKLGCCFRGCAAPPIGPHPFGLASPL